MENVGNSVLIQFASLSDIERIVNRAVERRLEEFVSRVQERRPKMVRRKEAARMLGVSLPTLDAYARCGLLSASHVGGRVFFREEDVLGFKCR